MQPQGNSNPLVSTTIRSISFNYRGNSMVKRQTSPKYVKRNYDSVVFDLVLLVFQNEGFKVGTEKKIDQIECITTKSSDNYHE